MTKYEIVQLKSDKVTPQPDYFKRRAILNIIVREAKILENRDDFHEKFEEYLKFLMDETLIYDYTLATARNPDTNDFLGFYLSVKIEELDLEYNEIKMEQTRAV